MNNKIFCIDYGRHVYQLPVFIFVQNTHTFVKQKYRAIFDTGATSSVISQKVFDELSLDKLGDKNIASANGLSIVPLAVVNIELINGDIFKYIKTPVSNLPQGIDALLGMDIITRGNFHIDNHTPHADKTVLTFMAGLTKQSILQQPS